ncbi:hypothetical protein FRC20_002309, partial [Serendipita sp. 405]
ISAYSTIRLNGHTPNFVECDFQIWELGVWFWHFTHQSNAYFSPSIKGGKIRIPTRVFPLTNLFANGPLTLPCVALSRLWDTPPYPCFVLAFASHFCHCRLLVFLPAFVRVCGCDRGREREDMFSTTFLNRRRFPISPRFDYSIRCSFSQDPDADPGTRQFQEQSAAAVTALKG